MFYKKKFIVASLQTLLKFVHNNPINKSEELVQVMVS